MLCTELDLHKCLDATNCTMKVNTRKVRDAQGKAVSIFEGMHRDAWGLYSSIHSHTDWLLVNVSKRLKISFDCEAWSLLQGVSDGARVAAKSF